MMPKVGKKTFSYGPAGMKAAKAEATRSGGKVVIKKGVKRK